MSCPGKEDLMQDKIKHFLKTIKLNESLLSMFFGMVTVILIGILVYRLYNANKPAITEQAETITQEDVTKVGEVAVTTKEDGKKYPANLPDTYRVEKGDHLWKIAEKFYGSGYNWVDIAKENKLAQSSRLEVGQELKLPKVAVIELKKDAAKSQEKIVMAGVTNKIEGDSYTVVKGDHLWGIAVRAYGDGYKWVEIAKNNGITDPNYIEVGQVIKLAR